MGADLHGEMNRWNAIRCRCAHYATQPSLFYIYIYIIERERERERERVRRRELDFMLLG